jgi:hypothetical protein
MQGEVERAVRCGRHYSDLQALNVDARGWFGGPGRSSKQANAASLFLGHQKGLTLV